MTTWVFASLVMIFTLGWMTGRLRRRLTSAEASLLRLHESHAKMVDAIADVDTALTELRSANTDLVRGMIEFNTAKEGLSTLLNEHGSRLIKLETRPQKPEEPDKEEPQRRPWNEIKARAGRAV